MSPPRVLLTFAEELVDKVFVAVAAFTDAKKMRENAETIRKRLEPICLHYLERAHLLGCGDVADKDTLSRLLNTHVERLAVSAAELRTEAERLVKQAEWLRELASRDKK